MVDVYKLTTPNGMLMCHMYIAYDDFSRRISFYQNAYEPLDDDTMSYVKLIDENTQIVSNRIEGTAVCCLRD